MFRSGMMGLLNDIMLYVGIVLYLLALPESFHIQGAPWWGYHVLQTHFSSIRSPNLSTVSDDKSLNGKKYKIVPVLNQALSHEGIIFKLST